MRQPRPAAGVLAAVALVAALCGGCSLTTRTAAKRSATVPTGASSHGSAGPSASAAAGGPASASPSTSASTSPSASSSGSAGASPSTPGTVLATASIGALGTVLVSSHGRTMYLYDKDSTTSSTCYDACADAWPPVTTRGTPVASNGVDDGLIGTSMRTDGKVQVLYNGHPLYYFNGDEAPGDTYGEGSSAFDSTWHTVSSQGSRADG